MTTEEFREFAKSYKIHPQIDVNGNIQDGARMLFEQAFANSPSVRFIETTDKRVLQEKLIYSYLGETLMQAITQIENEYPVVFALLETESGGLEVSLEYHPRNLTFKEVIEYRRTHPE